MCTRTAMEYREEGLRRTQRRTVRTRIGIILFTNSVWGNGPNDFYITCSVTLPN